MLKVSVAGRSVTAAVQDTATYLSGMRALDVTVHLMSEPMLTEGKMVLRSKIHRSTPGCGTGRARRFCTTRPAHTRPGRLPLVFCALKH